MSSSRSYREKCSFMHSKIPKECNLILWIRPGTRQLSAKGALSSQLAPPYGCSGNFWVLSHPQWPSSIHSGRKILKNFAFWNYCHCSWVLDYSLHSSVCSPSLWHISCKAFLRRATGELAQYGPAFLFHWSNSSLGLLLPVQGCHYNVFIFLILFLFWAIWLRDSFFKVLYSNIIKTTWRNVQVSKGHVRGSREKKQRRKSRSGKLGFHNTTHVICQKCFSNPLLLVFFFSFLLNQSLFKGKQKFCFHPKQYS